jgi:hypothetical protein
VTPDRQAFLDAFDQRIGTLLRADDFRGNAGHYVARSQDVERVVEVQLSIYGARVTANLGLNLAWLLPAVRWVSAPELGPHAHECVRWVRLGIVGAKAHDHWWSFETPEERDVALEELRAEIFGPGRAWLLAESTQESFLRDAEARVARSKGPRHPSGRFAELRLYAAVLAWAGRVEEARRTAAQARSLWPEERDRLARALALFQDRYPPTKPDAAAVPDLLGELDRWIAP